MSQTEAAATPTRRPDDAEANRWAWLPRQMPGVQALLVDKRREVGKDWVGECWRRGVVQGEPGWFYGAEGALAVGTPWPEAVNTVCLRITPTQALLILRTRDLPEATDGAH